MGKLNSFCAWLRTRACLRFKCQKFSLCWETMDNLWECKDFSGRSRSNKQTHTCIFRLITSAQTILKGRLWRVQRLFTIVTTCFGTHTRYIIISAHAFLQQSVANLPSEYRRTLAFVVGNFINDLLCGNSWLWAADCSRSDAASFVISEKKKCQRMSNWSKIKIWAWTYRPKILLTHPFETCKILDISHGRAPECANSTIFCLVESGRGLPPITENLKFINVRILIQTA